MKWKIAGLLAAVLVNVHALPADACGIKLVIKTSTPRKAVARSSNPSHLLLVGTPPHRLERELSAAGHDVEVEPTPAQAKRNNYAVVVVDAAHADEARSKFPSSVVIVRSGDVTADISSVEGQVARKPVRADESRPVVAAREGRRPVAAGPEAPAHPVVAAKSPDPVEPAATTQPAVVATVQSTPAETIKPKEPKEPAAKPAKPTPPPAAAKPYRDETYFTVGAASVPAKSAQLDRAVRWLTANADLQVTIEGYADPTGNHDSNMVLSQRRAEAVRDYLTANGIDASRLEVVAFGDTKLKYSAGDPRNRRVAIVKK